MVIIGRSQIAGGGGVAPDIDFEYSGQYIRRAEDNVVEFLSTGVLTIKKDVYTDLFLVGGGGGGATYDDGYNADSGAGGAGGGGNGAKFRGSAGDGTPNTGGGGGGGFNYAHSPSDSTSGGSGGSGIICMRVHKE